MCLVPKIKKIKKKKLKQTKNNKYILKFCLFLLTNAINEKNLISQLIFHCFVEKIRMSETAHQEHSKIVINTFQLLRLHEY